MKQILIIISLLITVTVGSYAQVPSMPDAGNMGSVAKCGAVAEVLDDSIKNDDKSLIDTNAVRNPMGKGEGWGKRNMVLLTSSTIAIVLVAVAAARRRRTKVK